MNPIITRETDEATEMPVIQRYPKIPKPTVERFAGMVKQQAVSLCCSDL